MAGQQRKQRGPSRSARLASLHPNPRLIPPPFPEFTQPLPVDRTLSQEIVSANQALQQQAIMQQLANTNANTNTDADAASTTSSATLVSRITQLKDKLHHHRSSSNNKTEGEEGEGEEDGEDAKARRNKKKKKEKEEQLKHQELLRNQIRIGI